MSFEACLDQAIALLLRCGRWPTPTLLPTALAALRKKLDDLYRLRIAIDYAAASAAHTQAAFGLDVVRETLQMIARHTGWAL
jgi:hypothetical protein